LSRSCAMACSTPAPNRNGYASSFRNRCLAAGQYWPLSLHRES